MGDSLIFLDGVNLSAFSHSTRVLPYRQCCRVGTGSFQSCKGSFLLSALRAGGAEPQYFGFILTLTWIEGVDLLSTFTYNYSMLI